ncbi:DUF742 domain-containing protein [Nocardia neocaledoniensis]|uniref:DUF742 domain-containing protein n=1 Tax=Nocardia neocaledoniensis TaxID=236511 RepID=UPI0024545741|nr:DUF742 domain-containing protein [Nocardia neocaledoniensis]
MNFNDSDEWSLADDPGPLVRPFAVTRGRAGKGRHNLDILTLVVAIRSEAATTAFDREYGEIVQLCYERPLSIAEIAAHLNLLMAAVKVLVGDLIDSGHVITRSPSVPSTPDPTLLQAVLDGIRRI